MSNLLSMMISELVLTGVACVLFLLGCSARSSMRRIAPVIALAALVAVFIIEYLQRGPAAITDGALQVRVDDVARFLRMIASVVAIILLLLAWPSTRDGSGSPSLYLGRDAGEFFALFLLSIAGLMLTTTANDLIILFLALELTSIPTYIMVSMSRPASVAQEAGVKYFFLGALSIGLMLFGFSYLYGTTGHINLQMIAGTLAQTIKATGTLTPWQTMGIVLVLAGFAFKMAAFPLHFYAGDVYEGAATPVTAFLAFVPKTAGFAATLKLLAAVGGPEFALTPQLTKLLWIIAALTMTLGNVLGLLQNNVKRVLAYSSVAHTGYMLVAVAALPAVAKLGSPNSALQGVLFYLAAYGLTNAGAFGVLMLLPSRDGAGTAETYDDLAGVGRRRVGLALAMAVCCFSLIGIPLTIGFVGKLMLIKPALQGGLTWLVIILVINAAISAAYYLKIVATMFLRPEAGVGPAEIAGAPAEPYERPQLAVLAAVLVSVIGTILFGTIPRATQRLADNAAAQSTAAAQPVIAVPAPASPVVVAR